MLLTLPTNASLYPSKEPHYFSLRSKSTGLRFLFTILARPWQGDKIPLELLNWLTLFERSLCDSLKHYLRLSGAGFAHRRPFKGDGQNTAKRAT